MGGAFYNEIDPKAAAWLRELIRQGLIADGEVDERDIQDISPADIRGFTQCHFFAGIGVWSYALRRAGWPDDRPVWTGSCPCQPFSAAGKGGGFDDERHVWPAWQWLIEQCQPQFVFGEQVASKDAEPWLDLVQADLEGLGYAFGACAFPSASIGAPHIRDRSYWVADADRWQRGRLSVIRGSERDGQDSGRSQGSGFAGPRSDDGRMANTDDTRPQGRGGVPERSAERTAGPGGMAGGLADTNGRDASPERQQRGGQHGQQPQDGGAGRLGNAFGGGRQPQPTLLREHGDGMGSGGRQQVSGLEAGRHVPDLGRHAVSHGAGDQGEHGLREVAAHAGPVNGGWGNADWIYCRNGEWRPVEPGTFPLAHGAPARVGRLRGYGNAINAEAATAFIGSYLEARGLA